MKKFTYYLLLLPLLFVMNGCDSLTGDDDDGNIPGQEIPVSDNITESVTWKEGSIITIDGGVRVGGSQTVVITIEPGVIVKFKEGAYLDFAYWDDTYATIIAKGTPDKPIVFTSASPSPKAGDWNGLRFYKGAINSEFENCQFMYGGSNDYYGNIYIEETEVAFTKCTVSASSSYGFLLKENGKFSKFSDNVITGTALNPISVFPIGVSSLGTNNSYESGKTIYINGGEGLNTAGEYIWKNQGIPYELVGGMRVGVKNANGVNLTIEPGTVINFASGAYIEFSYWDDEYSTFIAKGTEKEPIVFTSASPSPKAGDWNNLKFYKGAVNCQLDYCEFNYGGAKEYYGNIYIEETAVSITNCKFMNSATYGILLNTDGEFSAFSNNYFSKQEFNPVFIMPNAVATMGAGNSFESGSTILVSDDEELTKSGNHIWHNQGVPYQIQGTLRIGSSNGTTLTIDAGTVLEFNSNTGLQVPYWSGNSGKLICNGTAEQRVTLTSASPTPSKGDWTGIEFGENCAGSTLTYTTIDYAGSNDYIGALSLDVSGNNNITLSNVIISNSASYGITVDSESSVDYSSVIFTNNDGADYYER